MLMCGPERLNKRLDRGSDCDRDLDRDFDRDRDLDRILLEQGVGYTVRGGGGDEGGIVQRSTMRCRSVGAALDPACPAQF